MVKAANKTYTIAEYLEREGRTVQKHEFFNGKICEVPGSTISHNLISTRLITELRNKLDNRKGKYFVFGSDIKIHIPEFNHVVYPDAVVICEKIDTFKNRKDIIINPF